MDGLKAEFGDQVEFYDLDIDNPTLDPIRKELGIRNRTEYILLDANGNVARRWFGPLQQEAMFAQVAALIEAPSE